MAHRADLHFFELLLAYQDQSRPHTETLFCIQGFFSCWNGSNNPKRDPNARPNSPETRPTHQLTRFSQKPDPSIRPSAPMVTIRPSNLTSHSHFSPEPTLIPRAKRSQVLPPQPLPDNFQQSHERRRAPYQTLRPPLIPSRVPSTVLPWS